MRLSILPAILLGAMALGTPAAAEETEFPHAAGTDTTGRAQALSDAAGRVLIESPEFPRGLWVQLADDEGQALAGIEVEYQGRPDSLVVIWAVDPSGDRPESLLWTRPAGDPLRLTLRAAHPPDLPPGLASIDWRIDPAAEGLLALEEGLDLIGSEAATAFLQDRWQGRTGRAAVRIDSITALAVDLGRAGAAERLVEYLEEGARSSVDEGTSSLVQVLLTTHTLDTDLALFEDSIVLSTSLVLVPGSELEKWVLPELGRARGPVTLTEVSTLTWLHLYAQIGDASPLAALTGLEELYMEDNGIADLSPLSGLTRLERLWLEYNEIVDLSPLAPLTRLVELGLGSNQIVDVSPLASLTSLEFLLLGGNRIVDVSPLASLASLKELGLRENRILEVGGMAALRNLERLTLVRNRIVDVSPLAALNSLEELWLESNHIADVSPLAALTNLEQLSLGYNEIVDANPLAGLTGLERLWLSGNRIVDVGSLAALTKLTGLSLTLNEIVDVSPLAVLTGLEWLGLGGNEIVDVSPLAVLTGLKRLGLGGNEIVDVSPLSSLTGLRYLGLDENELADVGPLSSLTRLVQLELRANEIQDIGPLVANSGLDQGDKVDLRDNPLSARAVLEQIPALKARGVEVTF